MCGATHAPPGRDLYRQLPGELDGGADATPRRARVDAKSRAVRRRGGASLSSTTKGGPEGPPSCVSWVWVASIRDYQLRLVGQPPPAELQLRAYEVPLFVIVNVRPLSDCLETV